MQKTYCLLVGLFFITSISFSQSVLDEGNYQLSGSIKYSYSESNNPYFDEESTQIQFAPQYGFFVIDNLLVGASVSFNYSEYKWTDPETDLSVSRYFGIGPLCKYYFRAGEFVPFVGASAEYNKYLGQDRYGYAVELSTGVDFFLAKSLAVEPFISYKFSNYYKPESDQNILSFGFRINYFVVD